jgi:hypothetical protein
MPGESVRLGDWCRLAPSIQGKPAWELIPKVYIRDLGGHVASESYIYYKRPIINIYEFFR